MRLTALVAAVTLALTQDAVPVGYVVAVSGRWAVDGVSVSPDRPFTVVMPSSRIDYLAPETGRVTDSIAVRLAGGMRVLRCVPVLRCFANPFGNAMRIENPNRVERATRLSVRFAAEPQLLPVVREAASTLSDSILRPYLTLGTGPDSFVADGIAVARNGEVALDVPTMASAAATIEASVCRIAVRGPSCDDGQSVATTCVIAGGRCTLRGVQPGLYEVRTAVRGQRGRQVEVARKPGLATVMLVVNEGQAASVLSKWIAGVAAIDSMRPPAGTSERMALLRALLLAQARGLKTAGASSP